MIAPGPEKDWQVIAIGMCCFTRRRDPSRGLFRVECIPALDRLRDEIVEMGQRLFRNVMAARIDHKDPTGQRPRFHALMCSDPQY